MSPSTKTALIGAVLNAASAVFVEAADVRDAFARQEQQEQARERIERREAAPFL